MSETIIVALISASAVAIPSIITQVIQARRNKDSHLEATRCSLRNDILDIYDKCRIDKKITLYQLQAIECSYTEYKKLNGNSFVKEIVKKVRTYEVID